ncbi:hypothetical protein ACIRL0_37385 [Streptomyces sp. NPDC102365]
MTRHPARPSTRHALECGPADRITPSRRPALGASRASRTADTPGAG